MKITVQHDTKLNAQYYLAEHREPDGRLAIAEAHSRADAMRACAAMVLRRRGLQWSATP